jgi:hypothetical protein
MMINNVNSNKKTVGNLYKEATDMFVKQMEDLKKRPLTDQEKEKAHNLAVVVSNGVLKDLKII